MSILGFLVVGLIAGALARLIVPGKDSMGILGTLVLGCVGSLVGGFLASLFTSGPVLDFNPAKIIGSVIGAIIVLLAFNAVTGRKGKVTS